MFSPSIDLVFNPRSFTFEYGPEVQGPGTEVRTLDSIRKSLLDPEAKGPEKLYAIAMDVFNSKDKKVLEEARLLLGVVAYNKGKIGNEMVRSQGHVHRISTHSGWSPPEIFEIWSGTAIIYMQERAENDPGRCYAITATPGDWVIVPPGWPHMVINGDLSKPMVFGALCDRGYEGFEYQQVRDHGGLAYFPLVNENDELVWKKNARYNSLSLIEKQPDQYSYFFSGLFPIRSSLYRLAVDHPEIFSFVPYPNHVEALWEGFIP